MNYLEAIEKRISRRAYSQTPIAKEKAAALKDRITEINEESGLLVYWIEDAGSAFDAFRKSYGMFSNVRSLFVMKGPAKDAHLREKAGYYGQRLVLEATMLDLGTCWIAGTYEKKNALFTAADGEEIIGVIAVGNVPQQQTLRERFIHNAVTRKTKAVEDFYEADKAVPEWFLDGIRAVQRAPSAINSQKVRFQYRNDTATAGVPETAKTDLIDLGIAKLHFELAAGGKFELGSGAAFKKFDGRK